MMRVELSLADLRPTNLLGRCSQAGQPYETSADTPEFAAWVMEQDPRTRLLYPISCFLGVRF